MSKQVVNNESSSLLPLGDVLIIVPPVVRVDIPAIGPHLLQACCRNVGITVRVSYTNLFFSSLIGSNLYQRIAKFLGLNFIGERLFASAAFGLPSMGRNIHRLIDPDWLPDHLWQKKSEIATRKMLDEFNPIRRWALSVDWQHIEKQAAQWSDSMAKQIAHMGYRVVGCTNTNAGLAPAIALLNRVKQADPNITTALGGALCEGEMAEGILSLQTSIDYVFSGESDITFPAFCKDVMTGKRPKEKIIRGQQVINLDEMPVPDYQEYFQQIENLSLKPFNGSIFHIQYETSRGCPWKKCTFCGLNGERNSYCTKSPDKVMQDLEQLVTKYPTNSVLMTDTIVPPQYFNTLFPRISKAFPSIRIRYEVSPNLTLDQVLALKKASVTLIQSGIESLSSLLLKRMRKKCTVRQNIALLRYVRSIGIKLQWYVLFGIPGDQVSEYEEMLELIPLIHHLPPPMQLFSTEICRFSPYHTTPEEYKISNLRPAGLYEDVLPSHANLEKIALCFTGDFKAQSYENSEIFNRLRKETQAWSMAWDYDETSSPNAQPPVLHIERRNKNTAEFALCDTRRLPGRQKRQVVDKEKANILLVARPWDNSPQLRWAVEAKLGVVRESWFIPLATAEPELLREFENQTG